jgi:hypothetical protein
LAGSELYLYNFINNNSLKKKIDCYTLCYKAEIFLSTFKKINKILINMNLNIQIKEFLIGTLLGDAHIGRTGLNKAFISRSSLCPPLGGG